MAKTQEQILIDFFKQKGVIRAFDLNELNISRMILMRCVAKGKILKVGRGLYMHPDYDLTEHFSFIEAAKILPNGIICLLSALNYHNIGTQLPADVWMTLPAGAWSPSATVFPFQIVRVGADIFTQGMEIQMLDAHAVRVYSLARTLADCFKFRRLVGLDVCIKALNEGHHKEKLDFNEVWKYAKMNRVAKIMQPYLEMMSEKHF